MFSFILFFYENDGMEKGLLKVAWFRMRTAAARADRKITILDRSPPHPPTQHKQLKCVKSVFFFTFIFLISI